MAPSTPKPHGNASTDAMRRFWDRRAHENAMWYINSELDFTSPDEAGFWASGERDLKVTLEVVDAALSGSERVLEIGCGIGRMTRALAAQAREVVGIDVSEEMVRRARKALADVANVSVSVGNGHDLSDFADGSFDVCYSFVVFQHIPDPVVTCGYIAEIGRVLAPGGWAVFQVSDKPEIHQRSTWAHTVTWRTRLGSLIGRKPRGCMEPQWLGSSLTGEQLKDALLRGGLTHERSAAEGSQYHIVYARRAAAELSEPAAGI